MLLLLYLPLPLPALLWFMHLAVLCGYQGADCDSEQLALTEQLFDAALGKLAVVARGQPCLIVGDSHRGAHQDPFPV